MPEFRSRIDSYRWQTPAFSEVFALDELSKVDDSLLHDMRTKLEEVFAVLSVPVSLSFERVMPSYSCYDVALEATVDKDRFQNSIYEIEAEHGWIIGYHQETETDLELLLRTDKHYPLNWKHVVTRITFRKSNAPTSFVIGVNLQQKTLILDWDSIEHFLIIGSGGSKQSVVRNILITAMMLNTPAEFRFALIGQGSDEYRFLKDAPHALGGTANINPERGSRLILGMKRELQRRQAIFERLDVQDFETCNILLDDDEDAMLPRLLLILDTLNHVDWIKKHENWLPLISDLIESGAQYGIHLLVTTSGLHLPYPFDEISERIPHKLITRSAAVDTPFLDKLENFHPSLSRFVDSYLVNEDTVHPIELPAITSFDIRAIVSYWQENQKNRHDSINRLNIGGNLEDTMRALVQDFIAEKSTVSPPIPGKPSAETLARAAEVLAEEERKEEVFAISDNVSANGHFVQESTDDVNISVDTIHRAQALATYLGWLGKGPLMDVLGLSVEEARTVIAMLQARQILERGSNPTPHLHINRRR